MKVSRENILSGKQEDLYTGTTLYNDGSVDHQATWAYAHFSTGSSTGDRLRLQGVIDKAKGFIGIDSVHVSTRERCSPRYKVNLF